MALDVLLNLQDSKRTREVPEFLDKISTMITGEDHKSDTPSRVAQSVTCLATDGSLTAYPGVVSLIPAQSHTFVEFDYEIISTVSLLSSAESFLTKRIGVSMCMKYWLTACSSLPRKKVWLGELTIPP